MQHLLSPRTTFPIATTSATLDEQAAFEPAETAYEKYLDVRAKCREDYEDRCQIDEEDNQDEPDS